jgi:hypothetical protein
MLAKRSVSARPIAAFDFVSENARTRSLVDPTIYRPNGHVFGSSVRTVYL